jgi:peptide/nickel transport system permease protein
MTSIADAPPRARRAALAAPLWRAILAIWRASPRLKLGLALFVLIVAVAFFESIITDLRLGGIGATDLGTFPRLAPPSLQNPLGTDVFGRDLLALLMLGLRFSLLVGLIAGGLATAVAVLVALLGGYSGGTVDQLLNMLTNAILVTPSLPVLMAVAAFARIDLFLLALVLAFFSWPWSARIIRAQVLSLRERPYVEFARVSGFGRLGIMFGEILPNLVPFIVVGFAYAVIGNILLETGLRLIGLGPGDVISLGLLLNWAMTFGALAQGRFLMVLGPTVCLLLIFVALSLINVGIEERFNPRLKGITGN